MENKDIEVIQVTAQEARMLYRLLTAGIASYLEYNPVYSDAFQTITNLLAKVEALARWSNEQIEKTNEEHITGTLTPYGEMNK